MNYDVIIVGVGPSGIFCAYELIKNKPNSKILIIEKGNPIEKRVCPKRTTGKCINCKVCAITAGFSGSGAFSDGKLTLTKDGETGGYLFDIVGNEEGQRLIKKTDDIYLKFGAPSKLYGEFETEEIKNIRRKSINANLKLVSCPIRHFGTDGGYEVYTNLQKYLLDNKVEMLFSTFVEDLKIENGKIKGVVLKDREIEADKVIVGVGRPGASWLQKICKNHNIKTSVGVVDVGVRVECRNEVMKELNEAMYEAKLILHTPTFDDKVRTFCTNPGGAVSAEVYGDGLVTVNGHAYAEQSKRTENTNFALLVSKQFTEPFNEPIEYGKSIARMANMLSDGKVLVQRFGDFIRGRRTTTNRLFRNNINPTLKDAVPGDLSYVLPSRIVNALLETFEELEKVCPGISGRDTILYGVEVKFYSAKIEVDNNLETKYKGVYAIGDGAGITRGLMQASISGVVAARNILKNK